jgi:hypothetical protein
MTSRENDPGFMTPRNISRIDIKIILKARILLPFASLFVPAVSNALSTTPYAPIDFNKEDMMLIRKNVSRRERIVRIAAGILMMLCGLLGLHATPLGMFVAAVGLVSIVTGLVRYCPACALAGKQPCDG